MASQLLQKNSVVAREPNQTDNQKSLFLSVSVWGVSIILCSAYRTPNADDQFMQKLYDHLLKYQGKGLKMAGDFNLPQIEWRNWSYGHSLSSDLLIDVITFSLSQVVSMQSGWGGGNILDLSSLSDVFGEGTVEIETGISDHKLISFSSSMAGNNV